MPFFHEASCSACDYSTGPLFSTGYQYTAVCLDCREVVQAARDPHCQFDDYQCPKCKRVLGDPPEPPQPIEACPRCGHKLIWEGRHISRHGYPAPRHAQRCQFWRIGRQDGRSLGKVGGQLLGLVGEIGEQPGFWYGEGLLAGAANDQIEVIHRIKDDVKSSVERLELTYSNTEAPWLAVDFLALRSGLERQALTYLGALETWCAPLEELELVAPRVARIGRANASRIFHSLLTLPTAVHCLTEVHAGDCWHPFTEVDLVMKYSSERIVRIEKGLAVAHNELDENLASRTPFWVDVFRDGERLARWGQPAMLRATNPTRE